MNDSASPARLADLANVRLRALARPARALKVAAEMPTAMDVLGLPVGDLRLVVKELMPQVRALSPEDAVEWALATIATGTFDGRQCAYEVLAQHKQALVTLRTRSFERLGKGIDNWLSVDTFTGCLVGPCWREHQITDAAVLRWTDSRDPWWRRAALASTVPLNLPSRGGQGDAQRTLMICERLVEDEHIAVKKALSWALRTLVRFDRAAVVAFLAEHEARLPALVLRETRRKLATGLKNG